MEMTIKNREYSDVVHSLSFNLVFQQELWNEKKV
jgi:hypothetical protein